MTRAFAPAKINLTLHITGQRDDGYHLLDSLVVFTDIGDELQIEPARGLTLEVSGPYATDVPVDGSNLILRAALCLHPSKGAKIRLQKSLPVASGMGGGSSDAAAALRGLSEIWGEPLPQEPASLGADVPVCLRARPTRMSGIGDRLDKVPTLPQSWLVLVNPRVAVPTPQVFARVASKQNPPMPKKVPAFDTVHSFTDWLGRMRNDMEPAAIGIKPVIATVLDVIKAQPGCLLGRMSGSGATCWGMFDSQAKAQRAARSIATQNPGWWVKPAEITPL